MPVLTRQAQIALRVETTEGTAAAPTATHARMLAYDLSFDPDIELFKRDPARAFLTPIKSVVGKKGGTCGWRTELKGSGTVGTRPAWDAALRCCGFTSNSVSASSGTVTGTFEPGETITGASGTGRIVGEITASPIRYVLVTGTFNSTDVVTGGVSGATGTLTAAAIASQGFEYRPTSDSPPSGTLDRYEDGLMKRLLGTRGNVTIEGNAGEPVFLNFAFDGVYDAVTDVSLLTVTYESTVPPVLLDAGASVSGFTMTWTQLNLAGDGAGGDGGLLRGAGGGHDRADVRRGRIDGGEQDHGSLPGDRVRDGRRGGPGRSLGRAVGVERGQHHGFHRGRRGADRHDLKEETAWAYYWILAIRSSM